MNNKEKIIHAFDELALHNYIDHINVQRITKEAGVSRTEFYRHFKDKYDLMNYVYLNEIEHKISISENKDWKLLTKYCYEFIYDRIEYFSKIVKYKSQNSFLEFLQEYSIRKTIDSMCAYKNIPRLDYDIEIAVKLYCSGCSYILGRWIESGFKKSPDQMCKIIYASVPRCLVPYFDGLQIKEGG